MKGYNSKSIRNVVLLGQCGGGKTTFLESALLESGAIKKAGEVASGSTVSDYDKMEIEKKYSINTSIVPVEWNDCKINFIDAPGDSDFVGEAIAGLRAAEAAVIMVNSSTGVEVGTENAWAECEKNKTPRFLVISRKADEEPLDMAEAMKTLREQFGGVLTAFTCPVKDNMNEEIKELIAMSDDALMEKYFNGDDFTEEEIQTGLIAGIQNGDIVPVITTPFIKGESVSDILNIVVNYVPSPLEHPEFPAVRNGEEVEIKCGQEGPASAYVFKTIVDPFIGKISIMKVITGKITTGMDMYNDRTGKTERLGKLFSMRGKEQIEVEGAEAGDIVAVAKLQNTLSGDTLSDKKDVIVYPELNLPLPTYYVAIEAKDKGEEEKMGTGLNRLREEDPSFVLTRNSETHQTLLGTQGDIQMNIILAKLKDRFGVDVNIIPQKVAYRETIKGTSDVQGKHKKQSGGAGQYGDVHIRFSPSDQEFEFGEELFGGSVPKNYVPAVEKGLIESMEKGPLAGCRVVNIKAILYDGSYHDVDSNEMAFKIAASLAFKKGIKAAKPVLLEPIMNLEIFIPDSYMGDVMGDMSKRRGKILGMEPTDDGRQKLMAEAPQSELFDYALGLRAMTQGRGKFQMEFSKYAEVPKEMADKIIEAHQESQAQGK